MMREEVLNQKLISLQGFLDQAKETSENGWLVTVIQKIHGPVMHWFINFLVFKQTLIDEDRLLSRIDLLEKQANLYTKNHSEDSLQATVAKLTREKFNLENSAKSAIQKMIEETNETLLKHDELKVNIFDYFMN